MNLLKIICFMGFICAALTACTDERPHSASVDRSLTPRPVTLEVDQRCPELQKAVFSQLNQMNIEISGDAETILQLTCATRPSNVSMSVVDGEDPDWNYDGSYPMVSETTIIAYSRDGKQLASAGAAIAHQREENMSTKLAELSLDKLFGQN